MIATHFPKQEVLDRLRNKIHHETNDVLWPNVIVNASYKRYQKSVPESSFSIFSNKNGTVKLNNNNRNLKICEQTFYLSNPFESFDYEINSEAPVDTFNIHLNYKFYSEALYALLNSNEKLLDYPDNSDTNYRFINQLHYKSPDIKKILGSYQQKEEEIFLLELLEYCLCIDYKDRIRMLNIPTAKMSTKKELLKRMQIAKDYIYSNYSNSELSVKELSKLVFMSHFHFLRNFKNVYGITPYQYLKRIRTERAKYLIKRTNLPIHEIAFLVGFKEASAIFPIIRNAVLKSPKEYRMEN
ncbi:AraC family transcriptional regulator [Labilibaculum sp. K2S]|uniref:helix-turn-helix transcriptional regulator n=1 Tax=Labilibaculum sp. K2S TaxID=3056386 RepID=UPI0025A39578|nr:AraC family transcriptional regulator [Labilibaculum sp. K2S]MDM8159662.1 AraC family transcriptional regulator [Labilibaculum sp. K2S]